MADRRAYLHLTPFVSPAVPEDTFWQPDAEFYDVGSIHRLATERLRSELAELEASPPPSSRGLLVGGGPGAGIPPPPPPPPTPPQAIEAWILERVVSGMCRRLGRRFTQLQGFLYALVLSGGEGPGAHPAQLPD